MRSRKVQKRPIHGAVKIIKKGSMDKNIAVGILKPKIVRDTALSMNKVSVVAVCKDAAKKKMQKKINMLRPRILFLSLSLPLNAAIPRPITVSRPIKSNNLPKRRGCCSSRANNAMAINKTI